VSLNQSTFVVTIPVVGAVTAVTLPGRIILPFDAELVAVQGVLGTAPSAGTVTLDVLKNGSTVYAGANSAAAKAAFLQTVATSNVSKATRTVAASAISLGAGGAQYTAGTNNIAPYTADGVPLASLAAGTDILTVAVSGTVTSAADLTVILHLQRK
jgi:hypothetical protein